MFMDMIKLDWVVNSLVFSLLGVVVFWVSFIIIDLLTPYDLWGEIVEKKNQALATVVAAMCIGIAIIIAAAVHG
jgi:putative membrane protein